MSNSTDRRIPSLDGFRAISILMVCYGHLSGTRNFPVSIVEYGRWCGDVAHLGVLVFFVISGFLITSLLMSEHEMTDAVSLKRFYLRRIVRIFPAFYAFILVMAVATLLGAAQLTGRDFAYALTYGQFRAEPRFADRTSLVVVGRGAVLSPVAADAAALA